MKSARLAAALLLCAIAAAAAPRASAEDGEAPLFRIFLKDGQTLVSFGELARVDDRVVFSMPTSASMENPDLHLVTIAADRVDWDRTQNYADAARATRYLALRAESDYAALTAEVAQTLNDVALTDSPAVRLALVEKARKRLADWPATHYGYKVDEIQETLALLDEAIAGLRVTAGLGQFNLTFVSASPGAFHPSETLLPPPTPKEAIEQTLLAARVTSSPAERTSLLAVAASAIDRDAAVLPAEWAEATRESVKADIAHEVELDRTYQALTERVVKLADTRARAADVRGVQSLLDDVQARDQAMGHARPDAVNALVTTVEDRLDAARRLRLARDRWELRQPAFRRYGEAVTRPLDRLASLKQSLEDIKMLAGSGPATLSSLQYTAQQIGRSLSLIEPPEEFREVHALLASAAQLAGSAATIRLEATFAGNIDRAWDASSAAAGALMLISRAQTELKATFRLPQLPK
jgi:hypothetical protein